VSHAINCSLDCYKKYKKKKEQDHGLSKLTNKKCLFCGKDFLANNRYKTCSKTCSNEWRRFKLRKPQIIKNCVICDAEFTSIASAKTCSYKCSNKYKTERQKKGLYKKDREKKPCLTCGKIFKPFNLRHVYCQKKCQEIKNLKPIRHLECEWCQKEFSTYNGFQKFCSEFCQQQAKVARAREQSWKRRGVPKGALVYCKICNCKFKQKHSRHIYCSPSCNANAQRESVWRSQQKAALNPRSCRFCAKNFYPKNRKSAAKFCSAKCRQDHRAVTKIEKNRKLEAQKENEEKLQQRWNDSAVKLHQCPKDSAFQDQILEFLKKGNSITKYLNPIWVPGSKVNEYEDNLLD
tara:strand:- start:1574 stop:2617 length:1044 start_codon:yes stop_codon:yes gene_type:complete